MPDGNWFNWLLFNSLSKISKCGVNCVVFDNKVQGMSMLERNVFSSRALYKSLKYTSYQTNVFQELILSFRLDV